MSGGLAPAWMPTSLSEFRNLVIGIVASWLVGSLLLASAALIEGVDAIVASIHTAYNTLGAVLLSVGALIGSIPVTLIEVYGAVLTTVATVAGPVAPIVVPLGWLLVPMLVGWLLSVLPFSRVLP